MASTTTPHPTSRPDPAAAPLLPDEDGARREVLVVGVAGRRVAIPLEHAREVIRARTITRVPGAPAWVIGLLNVRGAVIAVGDLRVLHGRARTAAREGLVVLVEDGGRTAGLRVAEIVGVHPAVWEAEPEADHDAGGDAGAGRGTAAGGEGGGLPLAGLARLTSDARMGADDAEGAEMPLLDVRAVLDALLEQPGDAYP